VGAARRRRAGVLEHHLADRTRRWTQGGRGRPGREGGGESGGGCSSSGGGVHRSRGPRGGGRVVRVCTRGGCSPAWAWPATVHEDSRWI